MNKSCKNFLYVFLFIILFSYANCVFAMLLAPEPDRISEDTVWTKDNGPYIISKWTELSADVTLTIEPGTKVEFDDKSHLTILGKLIVNGTEDEPVYFTSHYDMFDLYPQRTSISFYDNGSAEFKNTSISLGKTCLSFYEAFATTTLDNVSIMHCENGIDLYKSIINIKDSHITGNINGILSSESNVKIENSTIYNNKEYGILNGDLEYGSPTVEAINNWWGSADGPYYQNFNDDEISSIYNKVSKNVEYNPWFLSEPVIEEISLASSTESENDLNQDSKGVADKTIFTFETTYKNNKNIEPDSINLVIVDSNFATSSILLNIEENNQENDFSAGEKFFATSTFPKGNYIYYFEAKKGDNIIKSTPSSFVTGYSNVAFLPGLEASRLYVDDSGEEKRIWEPSLFSDIEYLSLDENGDSIKSGIYTKDVIDYAYVPIKGGIYSSFISSMNEIKKEGLIKDWATIPYDWRMSIDKLLDSGYKDENGNIYYFDENTNFSDPYILSEIRRLASSSDTGKVNIIAHSNGGLVTKELTKYLGDEASKLIENIIFVAVPQVGTPQAVGSLLHGFDEGIPIKMFPVFFNAEEARKLGLNMPSAYSLIPSEKYFDYVSTPIISFSNSDFLKDWIEKYGEEIKTSDDLYNFIFDNNREILETKNDLSALSDLNEKLYNQAVDLHNELDNWIISEGVNLIEIAGWGERTLSGIEYYQGIKTECISGNDISGCTKYNKIPILEYKPKLTINGDGTVVIPSALATPSSEQVRKYWVDLKKYGSDGFWSSNINREHADILEISELNDFIKNIISNNSELLPDYIFKSQPEKDILDNELIFSLHSPLTLNLYDDNGNHTGISTTTNEVEENIPGSSYLEFGELKYITVPASTTVHLSMQGYSSGSFTLNIDQYEGDNVVASTTFAGVPSATGTIVTTTILDGNLASSSPLVVDINGDGESEILLTPKINEIVETDLTKNNKNGRRRVINDESTSSESIKNDSDLDQLIDNEIKEIFSIQNIEKDTENLINNESQSIDNSKIEERNINTSSLAYTKNIKTKIKENKKEKISKEVVVPKENSEIDKKESFVASVGNIEKNSTFNKIISFFKKTIVRIFSW